MASGPISSVQFSSVGQSCPSLCYPMNCSTPGLLSITISQSLLKRMSVELMMPSDHLILCCPLFLLPSIFPCTRVFSNESVLPIRWPKYRSFSFRNQSFQWIFKTDFLYNWLVWSPCSPTDSRESSPTSQFKTIRSSALSFLYGPLLTSIHDYWKNHSFD